MACDPPQAEASKDEVAHLERVLSQEIQVPDMSCVLCHVWQPFCSACAPQESRLIASLLDEERQVAHMTCGVWRVACGVWRVACGV